MKIIKALILKISLASIHFALTSNTEELFSLSQKTDTRTTLKQSSIPTKRVGICFNIINSFMPKFDITNQKKNYENELIKMLNDQPEFKNIGQVDPTKKANSDRIYDVEKYETSLQLVTWMAFGSRSVFSANTKIEAYNIKNREMVKDIPAKAEQINKECRNILTDGFFNVYGLNTKKLQEEVNKAIMDLSKKINDNTLKDNDKQWIEKIRDSSCKENLNMLRSDFITNLLLSTKDRLDSKINKDTDYNYQAYNVKPENKIAAEEELTRLAFCTTVLNYFNEMLNPSSKTTDIFLQLFEYNFDYHFRKKYVSPKDTELSIKKATVNKFLKKIIREIIVNFIPEFKKQNKKEPSETKILNSDEINIVGILKKERDVHFQIDILITRWRERFNQMVKHFFEVQLKKGVDELSSFEYEKEFKEYFKTNITNAIQTEHYLVDFYIDMARQTIWELEGDRTIDLLEDQSSFLYIYLHHNYEVIREIPLSHSDKFIPKLLSNYYTLRKKFIFLEYEEMDFSMKRDTGDIFSTIVRDSMTVKLVKNKRNRLFLHYCEKMRTEKLTGSLESEDEYCKLMLPVMEESSIGGVEPPSLVAYGFAELFYTYYAKVRVELGTNKKFETEAKKKEAIDKLIQITRQMSKRKLMGLGYLLQVFGNQVKNSSDYYNLMLATFLFFTGDEFTISMYHFKAMKFCEMIADQNYGLKLFGRFFKHHETIDIISRFKQDLEKKYA